MWKPSFATGHKLIDDQHQELFQRLDRVVMAMEQNKGEAIIGETIGFLKGYVIEHFSDEEDLMAESQYPELEHHCQLHQYFIQDFLQLENGVLNGLWSEENSGEKLLALMVQWFIQHIMLEDQKFGQFWQSLNDL